MMSDFPLVSCIMPTYNRRAYVAQAIKYFLRQDYPQRELVIVDDGSEAIADLLPEQANIHYLQLPQKNSLGAKRNLACREARGEIMVHWDDDDWMAGWRLSYQVESLLTTQADVCGLNKLFFYDPAAMQAWQYIYPARSRPWVAGNTLCYTKAYWQSNAFPEAQSHPDKHFVWSDRDEKIVALEKITFFVALIHATNASPKPTYDARMQPYPTAEIRRLLGADAAFYDNLLINSQT